MGSGHHNDVNAVLNDNPEPDIFDNDCSGVVVFSRLPPGFLAASKLRLA